jgi:SAM-dependent methyltransferase
MPVTPPSLLEPPRFNPIFLSGDDLDDLASFTGMTPEDCRQRIEGYTNAEHAEAWRRADPETPEEMLDFYRSTDLYVWELMQWHASPDRTLVWHALSTVADQFKPTAGFRRVYDFGCGIGTDGLFLAERGYDVTLVDVDGPAFRFAQHRFERRGLRARFVESSSPLPKPDGMYDIAICLDVFEHLPDPLEAAKRIARAVRPGGLFIQQASFGYEEIHPCHLEEGAQRFSGGRWLMHFAGLGFRHVAPLISRKAVGLEKVLQHLRYLIWSRTGLWVTYLRAS